MALFAGFAHLAAAEVDENLGTSVLRRGLAFGSAAGLREPLCPLAEQAALEPRGLLLKQGGALVLEPRLAPALAKKPPPQPRSGYYTSRAPA